jgi:hypothetical protein
MKNALFFVVKSLLARSALPDRLAESVPGCAAPKALSRTNVASRCETPANGRDGRATRRSVSLAVDQARRPRQPAYLFPIRHYYNKELRNIHRTLWHFHLILLESAAKRLQRKRLSIAPGGLLNLVRRDSTVRSAWWRRMPAHIAWGAKCAQTGLGCAEGFMGAVRTDEPPKSQLRRAVVCRRQFGFGS